MTSAPLSQCLVLCSVILALAVTGCVTNETDNASSDSAEAIEKIVEELKIENILRDSLALAPDVEVIVSYLELPAGSELPTHYHPGEEFVYILEGEGVLTVLDEDIPLVAGDLYKIPLKAVHKFETSTSYGKAVVFRVHEKGQPDRILVEE